jgi:diguanylate cyclase (GGDEF)-like protein/PAS domain S-box-containing protein
MKESTALAVPEIPYRQLVDDSPLGILIIQDGVIKFANAAMSTLLGYSPEEIIGKSMLSFIIEEDKQKAIDVHERRMQGSKFLPSLIEYRVIARDGKIRHIQVAVRTIDWDGFAAYLGVTDITEFKHTEEALERSAHFDALTGVPNRTLLADRLRQELIQSSRSGRLLAVCYLDIDGFKPINDTWGHKTGDYLLVEMAGRLQTCLRGGDTVARLGGDEFVLLLLDLNRVEECEGALSRALAAVAQPIMIGGQSVTLSASIGVSIYPFDGEDPDLLLRQADAAMYLAKANGGNRYCFFEEQAISRKMQSRPR